jgi:hypothetical protein
METTDNLLNKYLVLRDQPQYQQSAVAEYVRPTVTNSEGWRCNRIEVLVLFSHKFPCCQLVGPLLCSCQPYNGNICPCFDCDIRLRIGKTELLCSLLFAPSQDFAE